MGMTSAGFVLRWLVTGRWKERGSVCVQRQARPATAAAAVAVAGAQAAAARTAYLFLISCMSTSNISPTQNFKIERRNIKHYNNNNN